MRKDGDGGGVELRVDLEELAEVGMVLLPGLANVHGDAARQIHLSSRNDHMILRTPGSGGERSSPVLASWKALRDLLQQAAGDTTVNLGDASKGLLRVVEMYGGADIENQELVDVPVPPVPGAPLPPEAYRPGED
ncbi:hypothetical protein AB0I28_21770 [Phytomonospora sp. NPDC050363]|uniref:hypothetical protein n=1 Tax=Phytomonospora sp. NPDC050363 TaxID=3155642 RepID=UPI0033D00C8A